MRLASDCALAYNNTGPEASVFENRLLCGSDSSFSIVVWCHVSHLHFYWIVEVKAKH